MRFPIRLGPSAVLALVGSAACSSSTESPQELVLEYDLALESPVTWSSGSSDYQASQEDAVEFLADRRPLPPSLGGRQAFYHAGTNISDDLWMFFARKISGLDPGTTYRVWFQTEFVTNYHSGCTVGTGASVWLKTGAANVEPARQLSGDGSWRMNVDKGEQSESGTAAKVLGDIRNGLLGCPTEPEYAANLLGPSGSDVDVTADASGAIWVFFGTESGFEVRHEIYYTRLVVGITDL